MSSLVQVVLDLLPWTAVSSLVVAEVDFWPSLLQVMLLPELSRAGELVVWFPPQPSMFFAQEGEADPPLSGQAAESVESGAVVISAPVVVCSPSPTPSSVPSLLVMMMVIPAVKVTMKM